MAKKLHQQGGTNAANKAAWQQSGVVKTLKWYAAEDDRVCQFCVILRGTVIGIDNNFYDEGSKIAGRGGGTMTANYGNIGAPPLHPDCRCYVRPEDISIV